MELLDRRRWNVLLFQFPQLLCFLLSGIAAAIVLCKIGVRYSFNVNEGWNAYWAGAAWNGEDLYPPPDSLKLNNYLPLWSYTTGALGAVIRDNIQAGRILAGSGLFLNAIGISLIVREITGRWSLFGAAIFLSIFVLFYETYVAVNDPQIASNAIMTLALFFFLRGIGKRSGGNAIYAAILLMLLGGLLKHNDISVPLSMCVFLAIYRRSALVGFIAFSAIGLATTCACLYGLYGSKIYAALLFPREYSFENAWDQMKDQLVRYNFFLLVIPYLALTCNSGARLILIYLIISSVEGLVFSGGADVDVNVFFDLAIGICIGVGLLQHSICNILSEETGSIRRNSTLALWLSITLIPVIASLQPGFEEGRVVFDSIVDNSQLAEIEYIKAVRGRVVCENLALCYWAGKAFEVDLNNLQTLVWAKPDLEDKFLKRIESCSYPLIQVDEDWDDESGPFTEDMREALRAHYIQSRTSEDRIYWSPSRCDNARQG
jgi:hypothetical protein